VCARVDCACARVLLDCDLPARLVRASSSQFSEHAPASFGLAPSAISILQPSSMAFPIPALLLDKIRKLALSPHHKFLGWS
jgi:hypothetical protein